MKEMFNPTSPGSYVMYLILLLSVVAIGFIVERFLAYASARTNVKRFFPEFEKRLRLSQFDEAKELCQGERGILPRVLEIGLGHVDLDADELQQVLADEVATEVLPRMEKNLTVLATIGKAAPMLGLLGTVMGMIQLFQSISHKADFTVSDISGGIFTALGTTAAGLIVAIPIVFFHAYFRTRVRGVELALFKHLTQFVRILRRRQEVA